jgi:hypothetical protein
MENAFEALLVFVSFFFTAGFAFNLGMMCVSKVFNWPMFGITIINKGP